MGSSVIQTSFKFPGQGDAIYFHLQYIKGQCLFAGPLMFDAFVMECLWIHTGG